MNTATAIERALSPAAVRGARRALARDLLQSIEQDMLTLGWFIETARTYSVPLSGWPAIRATAARAAKVIDRAEHLLRSANTRAA